MPKVILGLNKKALKSTIVSTSGCSANPNRQQDPTICLNPHHYQIGNYFRFILWSHNLRIGPNIQNLAKNLKLTCSDTVKFGTEGKKLKNSENSVISLFFLI